MRLFLLIILLCITTVSLATTYDASTLHNSVKRSTSVKDLFLERWDYIEENRYSLDLFGTINWVNNFKILSIDRQTDETKPVDMRLVRTYGGLAFVLPFGQNKTNYNNSSNIYRSHIVDDSDTVLTVDGGSNNYNPYRRSSNYTFAVSTYGYHYGLTKSSSIRRGEAGTSSVSDYKYTQFFDDIFAASFWWKSYVNVHTGMLINNAVEPQDDGTISYFSQSAIKRNWFLSSNLFTFMNFNFLVSGKLETFDISVSPTKLYAFFGGQISEYTPEITLGIKRSAMYNDTLYDPVWVKTIKAESDKRDRAALTLYTLLLEKKISKEFYASYYMACQNASKKLIEKRTGEKLDLKTIKETKGVVGYDVLPESHFKLVTELGYGQYWDEAMPLHSKSNNYKANGFFWLADVGYRAPDFIATGIKFTCSYNDSNELKRLIETTSKVIIQLDFYLSLKLSDW